MQLSQSPRSPCAVPRAVVDERNAEYRKRVAEVAARFPSLIVVDTQRPICDAQYCWAMREDQLLYMDGDHLNRTGAQYVTRHIMDSVFAGRKPVQPSRE